MGLRPLSANRIMAAVDPYRGMAAMLGMAYGTDTEVNTPQVPAPSVGTAAPFFPERALPTVALGSPTVLSTMAVLPLVDIQLKPFRKSSSHKSVNSAQGGEPNRGSETLGSTVIPAFEVSSSQDAATVQAEVQLGMVVQEKAAVPDVGEVPLTARGKAIAKKLNSKAKTEPPSAETDLPQAVRDRILKLRKKPSSEDLLSSAHGQAPKTPREKGASTSESQVTRQESLGEKAKKELAARALEDQLVQLSQQRQRSRLVKLSCREEVVEIPEQRQRQGSEATAENSGRDSPGRATVQYSVIEKPRQEPALNATPGRDGRSIAQYSISETPRFSKDDTAEESTRIGRNDEPAEESDELSGSLGSVGLLPAVDMLTPRRPSVDFAADTPLTGIGSMQSPSLAAIHQSPRRIVEGIEEIHPALQDDAQPRDPYPYPPMEEPRQPSLAFQESELESRRQLTFTQVPMMTNDMMSPPPSFLSLGSQPQGAPGPSPPGSGMFGQGAPGPSPPTSGMFGYGESASSNAMPPTSGSGSFSFPFGTGPLSAPASFSMPASVGAPPTAVGFGTLGNQSPRSQPRPPTSTVSSYIDRTVDGFATAPNSAVFNSYSSYSYPPTSARGRPDSFPPASALEAQPQGPSAQFPEGRIPSAYDMGGLWGSNTMTGAGPPTSARGRSDSFPPTSAPDAMRQEGRIPSAYDMGGLWGSNNMTGSNTMTGREEPRPMPSAYDMGGLWSSGNIGPPGAGNQYSMPGSGQFGNLIGDYSMPSSAQFGNQYSMPGTGYSVPSSDGHLRLGDDAQTFSSPDLPQRSPQMPPTTPRFLGVI